MTTTYVSATSPRGERYLRSFDTVTAARAAEVLLWMTGWRTRPLLTVLLGEQDDDQRRPTRDGQDANPILPPVGAMSSCSPSCVVCDDQGCPHCPKVTA